MLKRFDKKKLSRLDILGIFSHSVRCPFSCTIFMNLKNEEVPPAHAGERSDTYNLIFRYLFEAITNGRDITRLYSKIIRSCTSLGA